jgi:hypothetical protein
MGTRPPGFTELDPLPLHDAWRDAAAGSEWLGLRCALIVSVHVPGLRGIWLNLRDSNVTKYRDEIREIVFDRHLSVFCEFAQPTVK